MIKELESLFSKEKITDKKNYFEIIVNKENIFQTIKNLKDNKNLIFNQLIDITAIDYPSNSLRFEIIYILLSMFRNKRIIVKTFLGENEGIESITTIHKSLFFPNHHILPLYGLSEENLF